MDELNSPRGPAFKRYESGGGVGALACEVQFRLDTPGTVGLSYSWPIVADDTEQQPSDAQRYAVTQFYHISSGALTEDVSHVLLSVRNYSRAVAVGIDGDWPLDRDVISRIIASFVLDDTELIREAVWASEFAFGFDLMRCPVTEAASEQIIQWLREQVGELSHDALLPWRGAIEPWNAYG